MNDNPPAPQHDEGPLARYVPLLVWIGIVIGMVAIPLRVISQGFLPTDDGLRHVAKVLSGKTWQEIIVMRPEVTIDHNAGWHAILGAVHQITNWGGDNLMSFAIVALFAGFLLTPLFFFRRPEAWIAALIALVALDPGIVYRFALGRPYILVMAIFMAIILVWNRQKDRIPPAILGGTTIAIALASWIHGGWYMYWIPAAGLFLAQQWRRGALMTACWLAGSFLGGVFTGHPVQFLTSQVEVLVSCFGHHTQSRMLVTEFQPIVSNHTAPLLVGIVLVATAIGGTWTRKFARDPILMQVAFSWVMAFAVRRFWLDWGAPALLVWTALRFDELARKHISAGTLGRLVTAGCVVVATYLAMTTDRENRWTNNITKEYLRAENPELAGWLPAPGGIVYSDSMTIFYDTFFKNPRAPWRYILGFESTFMLPEDHAVYRATQRSRRSPAAFEPWVKKMRPQDRMILELSGEAPPPIAGLEWKYAATMIWIGRIPGTAVPAVR